MSTDAEPSLLAFIPEVTTSSIMQQPSLAAQQSYIHRNYVLAQHNAPIQSGEKWYEGHHNDTQAPDVVGLGLLNLYRPFVIVGPSGVGKGTIQNELHKKYGKDKFGFSVSYTTRKIRPGEEHGVHYFYIEKEEFEQMVADDAFVEWFQVHGNYYGTAKSQIQSIQAAGKIPLLDIDV